MARAGTDEQRASNADDVRTLSGSRLDTYLRVIRAQANDAAQAAKDETARFAHETFANLIEQERTYLENRPRDPGTEPSLAFDGNGLPDVESLRAALGNRAARNITSAPVLGDAYDRIDGDEWRKRVRKDRIAKRETHIELLNGPRNGLEMHLTECAYRDCVDTVGQTMPFYVRNAVTEYRVAFNELFWTQHTDHRVVQPMSEFKSPIALKKYDDMSFQYSLYRHHLTTPKSGIFRRRRIPTEAMTLFAHTHDARTVMMQNLIGSIETVFGPVTNRNELLEQINELKTAIARSKGNKKAVVSNPCEIFCRERQGSVGRIAQKGPYQVFGYYSELSYGSVHLIIEGSQIKDEANLKKIQKLLKPKNITL